MVGWSLAGRIGGQETVGGQKEEKQDVEEEKRTRGKEKRAKREEEVGGQKEEKGGRGGEKEKLQILEDVEEKGGRGEEKRTWRTWMRGGVGRDRDIES